MKITDIRYTQSYGWVMDAYLNKESILPVSIPFDYHIFYQKGFDFNQKRFEIKNLFEKRLAEYYNELMENKCKKTH